MIVATEEIETTAVEVLDMMNDMILSYALGGILAECAFFSSRLRSFILTRRP